jgi:hypothetical protein
MLVCAPQRGGALRSGLQRVVFWTGEIRECERGRVIERPGGGGYSV